MFRQTSENPTFRQASDNPMFRQTLENPMFVNYIKTELDLKEEDSDGNRHFLNNDGCVGDYKCEVCDVHYEEPYQLQLHILNEHREDK